MRSEWVSKYENLQKVWLNYRIWVTDWKCVSWDILGQNISDKFAKLSKIGFSMFIPYGMFYSWILQFSSLIIKISFWLASRLLTNSSKYFRDFLEIFLFPNILMFKSFENLWGSWYILFLLIITFLVKSNCAKTWKNVHKFCPRLQDKLLSTPCTRILE